MFGPDIERPNVTIALTEEQAIRGQVVDTNDEPVVNAQVRVKQIGLGGLASWIQCSDTSSGPPFWPKPMTTDDEDVLRCEASIATNPLPCGFTTSGSQPPTIGSPR